LLKYKDTPLCDRDIMLLQLLSLSAIDDNCSLYHLSNVMSKLIWFRSCFKQEPHLPLVTVEMHQRITVNDYGIIITTSRTDKC